MKDVAIADVRNFVLMGHMGSGKTTLCDALLFKLGLNDRLGSVPAGTSMSDYTEEEIGRKHSIYSQSFTGAYKTSSGAKVQFTFSDTPGTEDFVGQVMCASRVSDAALVVVDAASGIQVGTTKAWRRCSDLGLPRGVVITGLDRENVDFNRILGEIQKVWSHKCVPVTAISAGAVVDVRTVPDGNDELQAFKNALLERSAEADDALLEKFLAGTALTAEETARGMRGAVKNGALVPVFAVMALKDLGIKELLNGIADLFPSPMDVGVKDAEGQSINPSPDAPFVGFVWRSVTDPFSGKLAYVRVLSGTLKEGMELFNSVKGQKERVGSILLPNGKKPQPVPEARAGDIIALAKLKHTTLNDVVGAAGVKTPLPPITFPHPVVWLAVFGKDQSEDDKISMALHRVIEDDPTIKAERNADTNELVISGMGDAHLDVAREVMKHRSHVEVEFKTPKVSYKETVTALGDGHYKHKKQSGGRGQYGEVYCKVQPKKKDEEWFEDKVVGGVIPRNFIPACEKGFAEARVRGALAGYPVVDVKVTVYDGSYHDVDSSEIAFKIAALRAFREAMTKAKPVLLEPIMTVKVVVPDHFMGDINGDINHKRGRILGVDVEEGMQAITADVPQSEMFRFCSELRSITGGRGFFEMAFSRYDIVPSNIAQKVIAAADKHKDEEE